MNRKILSLILISSIVISAISCQKQTPQAADNEPVYNITLVFFSSPGNPFWTKVICGAREMGEKLNCRVDIQFAHNDPAKQNDIIETAISNKVDGIGIVLNNDEAYDDTVKKARAAGIGVVSFNNDDSKAAEGNPRMAYIGMDYVKGGEIIAKKLVDEAHLKAGDHVVCPVEHPEAVYAVCRYTGVSRILNANGITSEVLNTGNASLEESLNRLTQYLLGHKDTDAVLAMGGMPMEVAPQAIADASLKIPSAGFDLTPQIVRNIIDDKSIATIDQQPFYQGAFTVMQLYYFKKYGLMPCEINTGQALVEKNNASAVLELSGTVR